MYLRENPYNGTLSFDNILQSLEIVFVIMSVNTFSDLMYNTMDTDNIAACLFFIGCIFVMTVWLINVFIAIIVASFNITRMEVAEERKKRRKEEESSEFLDMQTRICQCMMTESSFKETERVIEMVL